MKKALVLLTALLAALMIPSCNNQPAPVSNDSTETTAEAEPTAEVTTEIPKDEKDFIEVYPMGEKKINVSRQSVVDYIHQMATVEWTPKETVTYTQSEPWKIDLTYEAGVPHRGVVYSFNHGSLAGFAAKLNEGVYDDTLEWSKAVGNDCTTAVMAAWQIVSPTTTYTSTAEMFSNSGKGVIPVGEYNWNDFLTDSTEVTKKTKKEEMFEIYATLQPGDILLSRWKDAGHCRLVDSETATVTRRKGAEQILGNHSYVTISEHNSSWNTKPKDYKTTWKINEIYTFETLYSNSYIPVTCVELATGLADAPRFTIEERATATELAEKGRLKGKLTCNYRLYSVDITTTDADGNVKFEATTYPTDREVTLSSFNSKASLFDYPAGTYTITIEASIGPGTFTVDAQTFTKN